MTIDWMSVQAKLHISWRPEPCGHHNRSPYTNTQGSLLTMIWAGKHRQPASALESISVSISFTEEGYCGVTVRLIRGHVEVPLWLYWNYVTFTIRLRNLYTEVPESLCWGHTEVTALDSTIWNIFTPSKRRIHLFTSATDVLTLAVNVWGTSTGEMAPAWPDRSFPTSVSE